jgi:N-acetylglucosamine kinase-like BadF-type ATPase
MASDQGSAFWIGREAVATALRDYDLGSLNGMYTTIAESWKASTPDEMIRIANSDVKARFAELAAPVTEAAKRGDAGAQIILQRAGEELATLAGIVIARLWPQRGTVHVACSGGVLQGSVLVQQGFQDTLQAEYPKARISFAPVRPVLGALSSASTFEAPQ